ncbi:RelA/SpoT domain-containing protein [Curtobacterium flaccumfaciens]|uniref:RelA/SpoT domain-containing protein n=1 Tax=Curtobacterium flaccumfaciens TaxID=2035 RepID=UPI001F335600|nr:RelA/SpoT domain-containing protein [Curtobacterium flaccumfaciens]
MADAEDLGSRYRDARPSLDEALVTYERDLKEVVSPLLSDYVVSGRVKTARSLIRKARADPSNPRSWTSIQDKIGLRIVCSTKEDVRTADGLIQRGPWHIVERTVKRGKHDQLFYPGIHFILSAASVVDDKEELILAEVQLRTRAQDAWSVVSHKLLYKGLVKPPGKMRRVIDRLTVLVELFDDEVQRMIRKRRKLPMYRPALALEALEQEYEDLSGEITPPSADVVLMNLLLSAYPSGADPVEDLVHKFCESNRSRISLLLKQRAPEAADYVDSRDWLYSQPEILAVLERAESKPYLLANAIANTDFEDVIRKACVSAGVVLPQGV